MSKPGVKAIVKFSNIFNNYGEGYLLTGSLLRGTVESGDNLVVSPDVKIPIVHVNISEEDALEYPRVYITLLKERQKDIGFGWQDKELAIE